MIKYGSLYKVLDELRIAKNMTISEITDGIISERTYLRHLKDESRVNFTIFSKLLSKLDINVSQFLQFLIHHNKKDNGIARFLIRVHVGHFTDIKPIYEEMKLFKSDSEIEMCVVNAMMLIYLFMIDELSLENLQIEYKKILKILDTYNQNNMIIIYLKLLYQVHFKDDLIIDIKTYTQILSEYKSTLSILYYILSLDIMLLYVSENKLLELPDYEKLLNIYKLYYPSFNMKNLEFNLESYTAYYYQLKNDYKMRDDYLFKSINNAFVVMSPHLHSKYKSVIETTFNIKIDEFLDSYLEKMTTKIEIK